MSVNSKELTVMITDDIIIKEAVRLVSEGLSVTLPVNGRSMLPFIIGGKESVILQQPEELKVGDVVLAWVVGDRYVVHRIISINAAPDQRAHAAAEQNAERPTQYADQAANQCAEAGQGFHEGFPQRQRKDYHCFHR